MRRQISTSAPHHAGGAGIKYGSLLADVPFGASPGLALAIIAAGPALCSVWLLSKSRNT
jgi:hypothetical protein